MKYSLDRLGTDQLSIVIGLAAVATASVVWVLWSALTTRKTATAFASTSSLSMPTPIAAQSPGSTPINAAT
jgi:hypothetical protein